MQIIEILPITAESGQAMACKGALHMVSGLLTSGTSSLGPQGRRSIAASIKRSSDYSWSCCRGSSRERDR